MTRKQITEEQNLQAEWYKEARDMTPEKLPEFLRKMSEDFDHDYGTVVHALTASGLAAMWAFNRSEGARGGITGFQAGCATWEILKHWADIDGYARILKFEEMLFPQYAYKFNTMDQDTWEWVQKQARKHLDEDPEKEMHPNVRRHMESIVAGNLPFGYTIKGD